MAEKKGWGGTVLGWFVEFEDEKTGAPPAPAAGSKAPPAPAASGDDATDDIIRRYAGGGGGAGKPATKPRTTPDTAPPRSPSGEVPPDFGGGPRKPPPAAAGTQTPAAGTAPSATGAAAPAPGPGGAIDFGEVFRKAGIAEAEADRVNRALTLLAQLPAETPQPVKKQIVEASLNSFGVPIESIIESAVAEIEALHACIQAGQNDTTSLLQQSQQRIEQLQQQIADVQKVMAVRAEEQRSLEQQARTQGLKVQQILEFFGQDVVAKVVKDSPRLHEP